MAQVEIRIASTFTIIIRSDPQLLLFVPKHRKNFRKKRTRYSENKCQSQDKYALLHIKDIEMLECFSSA